MNDVAERGKRKMSRVAENDVAGKVAETCICIAVMMSHGVNGRLARSAAADSGRGPPPSVVRRRSLSQLPRAVLTVYYIYH